ncbi:MAG: hypothetical protein WBX25_35080, partial [Rhodomicrobium sp.]
SGGYGGRFFDMVDSWNTNVRMSTKPGELHGAIAVMAEGFAKLAMISVMLKRLAEPKLTPAS